MSPLADAGRLVHGEERQAPRAREPRRRRVPPPVEEALGADVHHGEVAPLDADQPELVLVGR